MKIPYVITGVGLSQADLQDAMDACTLIGERQIKRYGLPHILLSGVVYERERRGHPLPGVERFQTALDVYVMGYGDCDGLAPYHASWLKTKGIDARARVIRSPGVGYHVLTEREDVGGVARIDDPSAWLGMLDGVDRYAADAEESARERRRRRGISFLKSAVAKAKGAGKMYGGAQTSMLRSALAESKHASALLSRNGRVALPGSEEDE
jgi:hypothetical protein